MINILSMLGIYLTLMITNTSTQASTPFNNYTIDNPYHNVLDFFTCEVARSDAILLNDISANALYNTRLTFYSIDESTSFNTQIGYIQYDPTYTAVNFVFNDDYLINYNAHVVYTITNFLGTADKYSGNFFLDLWDANNNQYQFTDSNLLASDRIFFTIYFFEQDPTLVTAYNNGNIDTQSAYDSGYENGWDDALDSGPFYDAQTEAWNNGYDEGYDDGYANGQQQDEQISSIFVGILNIALVPINFFLGILNFEVFGINIGGFVTGLLTIAIVIIIFRIFIGSNGGGSNDK